MGERGDDTAAFLVAFDAALQPGQAGIVRVERVVDESSVFVKPVLVEAKGHIGNFYSDESRFSFCYCSCGWSNDTRGAERMLELWRSHREDAPTSGLTSPSP